MCRETSKFIAVLTLLAVSGAVQASYEVDCEGYNDETSSHVSGTCTDGDFDGIDSDTGAQVSGYCEFDGDLDATDSETDEHVSGDCDGE